MKTDYDEIILKYLSDILSGSEKIEFENKLKTDSNLRNRFEEINSKMNEINSLMPDEVDSLYFSSLTPKVREKLSSKKSRKSLFTLKKAMAFGFAAVSILVITLLNFDKTLTTESDFRNSIDDAIAYSDSIEFNEFVELRSFSEEEIDYINDVELDNYSDILGEQIFSEELTMADYSDYSYVGVDGISDLSEEEMEEIYSHLINKKIL